jgi:ATP-dependent Zn protease
MSPGFTGADIENLVNTAVTHAVNQDKEFAEMIDFEYARDRIMMGIERKKLSMTEKERFNTAIHEAGHTVTCYFTPGAKKLHKATIVSRGGSLGVTQMMPSETDEISLNKQSALASIDVAMGGHVAEGLFIGNDRVTSGCSNDFENATKLAYSAVRRFGMFGEHAGYISEEKDNLSDRHNAMVDKTVQEILKQSKERVTALLMNREIALRDVATNLYRYDTLDSEEIANTIKGVDLTKTKVRDVDENDLSGYKIKF